MKSRLNIRLPFKLDENNKIFAILDPLSPPELLLSKLEDIINEKIDELASGGARDHFIQALTCDYKIDPNICIKHLNIWIEKIAKDRSLLNFEVVSTLIVFLRDIGSVAAHGDIIRMMNVVESKDEQLFRNPMLQYYLAFSLNRRNEADDRKKALQIARQIVLASDQVQADYYGLVGRICKDEYLDSKRTSPDASLLDEAVKSYSAGFAKTYDTYNGINLLTLLNVKRFSSKGPPSETDENEFQKHATNMGFLLSSSSKLEELEHSNDYWEVATYLEYYFNKEDYESAIKAIEIIYKKDFPVIWKEKSTLSNLGLIRNCFEQGKKKQAQTSFEQIVFYKWLEFFNQQLYSCPVKDCLRFNVIYVYQGKFLPCEMQLNLDYGSESESVVISFEKLLNDSSKYDLSNKGIPLFKEDSKVHLVCRSDGDIKWLQKNCIDNKRHSVLVITRFASKGFQFEFPTEKCRDIFYEHILPYTSLEESFPKQDVIVSLVISKFNIAVQLVEDVKTEHIGSGQYGNVFKAYAKINGDMPRPVAIKEFNFSEQDYEE
ncbi:protein kinase kinase kinase [Cichlidogyrus casuarinus]|uniref:Protein kinase kinase kinase n=1 Tax=Cichlidogyrus casuarinus TaxID=1844966 RepID=A0ABD2Q7C6_9PLAT